MVNLTIDGKQVSVPEGTTVLQAARMANVHIPTLCDHPNLTPYGGCRLCLVDVKGARTPQPSCTLPVTPNMDVQTDTPKIRQARKFVLTLLFSERNHFCMYCQKSGGDCELQDCAYAEGMDHWPLPPNWQPYAVDASHPYFVMDHNRCILCRRCVRACGELVGNFTLGFEERGAKSFLVADLGNPLGESTCVSCGTCVQVCPTGALIDRKSAYMGTADKTETVKTICRSCSVGCGIEVSVRDNRVMRINGDWTAPVNSGVLCVNGRFKPMDEERERVVTPMVRKDGVLKAATWEEALDVVANKLSSLKGANGSGIAALASPRLSAEALAAFQQLFADGLQAGVVTAAEDESPTAASTRAARKLGRPFAGRLETLDQADVIVAMGIDLTDDHPVVGFFVKRAVPKGTRLILIDEQTSALAGLAESVLKPAADMTPAALEALATAAAQMRAGLDAGEGLAQAAAKTGLPEAALTAAARALAAAQRPALVYGSKATTADLTGAVTLARALNMLSENSSAIVAAVGRPNSMAAAQYGLEQPFAVNGQQAAFLALGDDQVSQRLLQKIEKTPFVVVQASYHTAATARADVVLPVEMWAETDGHYMNMEGRLQHAAPAVQRPEGVWTNQQVLEGLALRVGSAIDPDWKAPLAQPTAPVSAFEN